MYIHTLLHVLYIGQARSLDKLVERMRQDHRVDSTSENCVSMYVLVPSNFLLMLYYIILNLKKEYGNCGGRVNLKVSQPKTKTKKKNFPLARPKKNMIQYPIAAYHIALCHVHIYRLDTSKTFSFFQRAGEGEEGGRGRKRGRER